MPNVLNLPTPDHLVQNSVGSPAQIIAGIVVCLVVAKILLPFYFESKKDLDESVEAAVRPDLLSMMQGRDLEDTRSEFNLAMYLIACGGAGYLAYWLIGKLLH